VTLGIDNDAREALVGEAAGTPSRSGGRPPHQPTAERRKQARAMALRGIPHRHIAAVIGVAEHTLRKHYAAELAAGMADGAVWTADRIRALAEKGHWPALKQMAAIYLDWTDKVDHRVTAPDGGPLQAEGYFSIPEDQRLAALETMLARLKETARVRIDAAADGFEPEGGPA
jgi:hypothetical protein